MTNLPPDGVLADIGLPPRHQGRILLIACGALGHEILALKHRNGWAHLDLQCLPANLHLWPDRIADAVEASVVAHRDAYDSIFVVYADCGTGGLLQARCATLGVEMMAGPHCYAFFSGNAAFEQRADEDLTAFFLTDYLARHFDKLIWQGLGLDRHPELLPDYFGNYTKIVFLAQTRNDDLTRLAQDAARRLGLRFEYRFTGYGELESDLETRTRGQNALS